MVSDVIPKIESEDVNSINILALAYIGDSVWEMYVRDYVIFKNKFSKVQKLHKESTNYVKASAQASIVKKLKEQNIIDDDMWSVVIRGRNSANNPPKNANAQDYSYATGFEALLGYLYIIRDYKKLDEIANSSLV